MTFWVKIMI